MIIRPWGVRSVSKQKTLIREKDYYLKSFTTINFLILIIKNCVYIFNQILSSVVQDAYGRFFKVYGNLKGIVWFVASITLPPVGSSFRIP